MHQALKKILEIQELDIKMIQLMRIKRQRQKELTQIESLRTDLHNQLTEKKSEIEELNNVITAKEASLVELSERIKHLDERQSSVKKVDEFNALTQEMTTVERQKAALENEISNLVDKKVTEEEIEAKIKESLKATETSSKEIEAEIRTSIQQVNEEGSVIKKDRDVMAKDADPSVLSIYDRLLRNKRDRVVVPIENRTCSGCHIALTPQHENLVRKGENIVFCEHCSRIHYWQEEAVGGEEKTTRRRRRRAAAL